MMSPFLSILCLLSAILSLTHATSLRIQIPANNHLPNPNALPSSTHATLTAGTSPALRAILRQDNTLIFTDVPTTGSHLLSIYSATYTFASYRIDISTNASITGIWELYPGSPWDQTGPPLLPTSTPDATFSAKCTSMKNFYEERAGFNALSLLKNPMILLGIVALAFTFGMPKLMENMDPEMRAEYEEMQKKSPVAGLTKAVQGAQQGGGGGGMGDFDLAGWMAGQKSGSGETKGSGADVGAGGEKVRRR